MTKKHLITLTDVSVNVQPVAAGVLALVITEQSDTGDTYVVHMSDETWESIVEQAKPEQKPKLHVAGAHQMPKEPA